MGNDLLAFTQFNCQLNSVNSNQSSKSYLKMKEIFYWKKTKFFIFYDPLWGRRLEISPQLFWLMFKTI